MESRGGFSALAIAACALLAGCQQEERSFRLDPPLAASLESYRIMPIGISGAPPETYSAMNKPYESNAFQLSQGKRLFRDIGCRDCHGEGEGGKGPAFLDWQWTYGPELVSIVESIRNGRPHGMPGFSDRLTSEQIWQVAAYVQTLGAYRAKIVAPGRSDDRQSHPAENRAPAALLFDEYESGPKDESM